MTVLDRALSLLNGSAKVPSQRAGRPRLSLALQGGGSFGAFTWGVLDRLLEEDDLEFDVVSGASAGAVNAVLIAAGLLAGGRREARLRLNRFWSRVSKSESLPGFGKMTTDAGFGFLTRMFSPYQFNPLDINPLRAALAEEIDFPRLADADALRLMIAATRVSDGSSRIFRNAEISLEAVLASACLPKVQHAVVIDGEAYWDGGYALNPPLLALAHESETSNILLVQLTPMRMDAVPRTREDIELRLDRIMFNATLNAQMDALRTGAASGRDGKLNCLRIDTIAAEDEVTDLIDRSPVNLDWRFLEELRDGGRVAAGRWLKSFGILSNEHA